LNAPASDQSLWAFACERYSDKRSQACLLEAQNTYQVSICAVLWCYWLDTYKKPLSLAEFESGLALCRSVDQSVLAPLRALRQQPVMASTQHYSFSHTKKTLLHAELQIEKELLSSLEVLTLSSDCPTKAAYSHNGFLVAFLGSKPQALKALLPVF